MLTFILCVCIKQQVCIFCGNPVRLGDEASVGHEPAEEGAQASTNSESDSGQQSGRHSKALEAALSFKNRLVDFDRNSAKRTTVLDDQSDYVSEPPSDRSVVVVACCVLSLFLTYCFWISEKKLNLILNQALGVSLVIRTRLCPWPCAV